MTVVGRTASAAAFPLGGIGTGNFSIGARGQFRDWELANRPNKGNSLPFSFFAIHAAPSDGDAVTRVLESRLVAPHEHEQGYAVPSVGGLPRLADSTLTGEYPLVRIGFDDPVLPVAVSLEAFTPLIPLEVADSGIPAAILRYRVTNPGASPVTVSIVGSLSNPIGSRPGRQHVEFPEFDGHPSIERRSRDGLEGLVFSTDLPTDDLRFGELTLATSDSSVTSKRQWLVGFWQDGVQAFWNDLRDDGLLEDEAVFSLDSDLPPLLAASAGSGARDHLEDHLTRLRVGSLGIVHDLAAGESRDFEFVLSWSFPNRPMGWIGHVIEDDPLAAVITRNCYATRFATSWDSARYLVDNLGRLESGTRAFHDSLYGGTLDPAVLDAIGANISVLRSTTCFLTEDGGFAAWEGSFDHSGSCEGNCTHVWSYAQTVAHLFPELERSSRRVEFLLETDANGAMQFRTNRIFGGPAWGMLPAIDGQCGTILRLYREWRFSGDDEFLRELWPAAQRALDYVGRAWDRNGDGMIDSRAHNTYDIEFYGSEPLGSIYYLAALHAGVAIAAHLGDATAAARYRALAAAGAGAVDAALFNGEYFRQLIDDVDAHRYQYGDGVLSDQLLGQSLAHVVGLGHVVDPDHARRAISAVFRHNFRSDLSSHESTQRTYALGDEGGLLLASWPNGGRPRIPFVYSDEVWTGIEYQVAAHLAYEGFVEDALTIVRTTRARHDGVRRSPWNEPECGNHYARSLASWSLLLAFSGVQWNAPAASLSFAPAVSGEFESFFSTNTGWGTVHLDEAGISLRVAGGALALSHLFVHESEVALPGGAIVLEAGSEISLSPVLVCH
jgi:non-lysosomal glucosylceramidase